MANAGKKPKKTYGQKWSQYNAAQVAEKRKFLLLLYELCQGVIEPPQPLGRPRLPVRDMLYCMALKVYIKFPMRRSVSDLEVAYERGFISRIPGLQHDFELPWYEGSHFLSEPVDHRE